LKKDLGVSHAEVFRQVAFSHRRAVDDVVRRWHAFKAGLPAAATETMCHRKLAAFPMRGKQRWDFNQQMLTES